MIMRTEVGLKEKPAYTRYIKTLHRNPNHRECGQTKDVIPNVMPFIIGKCRLGKG